MKPITIKIVTMGTATTAVKKVGIVLLVKYKDVLYKNMKRTKHTFKKHFFSADTPPALCATFYLLLANSTPTDSAH